MTERDITRVFATFNAASPEFAAVTAPARARTPLYTIGRREDRP
jgi:hypothetical protein